MNNQLNQQKLIDQGYEISFHRDITAVEPGADCALNMVLGNQIVATLNVGILKRFIVINELEVHLDHQGKGLEDVLIDYAEKATGKAMLVVEELPYQK